MTNRDRDAAAKLLLQVATELAMAPGRAQENAERNAASNPTPYQVGALEVVCENQAYAIRHLVNEYLIPRPSKVVRGKR